VFSFRAEATCKSSSMFMSVCLCSPFPEANAQSLPHVCVFFLVSTFLPPCLCSLCLSLPSPPPLSVAAVLVMAVCPWCKLAVGSQVAHMTVIDVQVFSSSHTGTPESHTHTHTHTHTDTHREIHAEPIRPKCALRCSSHTYTEHMQVVLFLHYYAYKRHIRLLLLRKCKQHTNKYYREFGYAAAGLSGENYSFQYDMKTTSLVKTFAVQFVCFPMVQGLGLLFVSAYVVG